MGAGSQRVLAYLQNIALAIAYIGLAVTLSFKVSSLLIVSDAAIHLPDRVMTWLPFWLVSGAAVALDLGVCVLITARVDRGWKLVACTGIGVIFLTYRTMLAIMDPVAPCGCLGASTRPMGWADLFTQLLLWHLLGVCGLLRVLNGCLRRPLADAVPVVSTRVTTSGCAVALSIGLGIMLQAAQSERSSGYRLEGTYRAVRYNPATGKTTSEDERVFDVQVGEHVTLLHIRKTGGRPFTNSHLLEIIEYTSFYDGHYRYDVYEPPQGSRRWKWSAVVRPAGDEYPRTLSFAAEVIWMAFASTHYLNGEPPQVPFPLSSVVHGDYPTTDTAVLDRSQESPWLPERYTLRSQPVTGGRTASLGATQSGKLERPVRTGFYSVDSTTRVGGLMFPRQARLQVMEAPLARLQEQRAVLRIELRVTHAATCSERPQLPAPEGLVHVADLREVAVVGDSVRYLATNAYCLPLDDPTYVTAKADAVRTVRRYEAARQRGQAAQRTQGWLTTALAAVLLAAPVVAWNVRRMAGYFPNKKNSKTT